MSGVILLVLPQLMRHIRNYMSLFHQYTIKTLFRIITIDVETLVNIMHNQILVQ
jgi:hypothetical protein